MKKYICLLSLILVALLSLTACKEQEETTEKPVVSVSEISTEKEYEEVDENAWASTIDTTDLQEGYCRVRFYAKAGGNTMLGEDYYTILELKDYFTGEKFYIELDAENPVQIIDLPKSRYNIYVIESETINHQISLGEQFTYFDTTTKVYKVSVKGPVKQNITTTEETTEEQQPIYEKPDNSFIGIIKNNIFVIIIIGVCGGFLLFRKIRKIN